MKITLGPTGQSVVGHVLDVSKESLELKLRHYEPRLYIKWNPRKRGGWGCYELRLRPEKKYAVPYGEFMGGHLVVAEYHEIEGEAHVYDLPYLGYDLLDKVKEGDTWSIFGRPDETNAHQARKNQWIKDIESAEEQRLIDGEKKTRDEAIYHFTQYKGALRDYRNSILSGMNPAEIARFWGKE